MTTQKCVNLIKEEIQSYIGEEMDIYVYDSVTSTNTLLKEMAREGAKNHSLVVAEAQSAGRGRNAKKFFSPANKGIYMSFLLYQNDSNACLITIQSALAITRAIYKLYHKQVQIKWVNDIYYHNKKICGILTEALRISENENINAYIIGIGLNVSTKEEEFPKELQSLVTSLGIETSNRNELIGEIVLQLLQVQNESSMSIIEEYKAKSLVLHKEITFQRNGIEYIGYVKDINQQGNLIVDVDHKDMILSSGEVSIKSRNQWEK